jgi:D-alanine-D-alanine ligase
MTTRSDFGRVAVLLGGRSAEREVSLKSGSMVLAALLKKGIDAHPFDPADRPLQALVTEGFDRVFIALHGRHGEDGTVQGALELAGIPYTGSGVLASALAMDKWRTKLLWRACGVSTPPCELLHDGIDLPAVTQRLGLPLMVKPATEGSSIGMSKVRSVSFMERAYELASKHDPVVIAEQFVDGIELTAGILAGEALPLIRLETTRDFYDYEAKYLADDTRYIIPCGLPPEAEHSIQQEALRAFDALGCRGWGRVDIMLDGVGKPYFLEVNTAPGMTDHSLVPMAARHAGLSYEDLCVRILEQAALHSSVGGGART